MGTSRVAQLIWSPKRKERYKGSQSLSLGPTVLWRLKEECHLWSTLGSGLFTSLRSSQVWHNPILSLMDSEATPNLPLSLSNSMEASRSRTTRSMSSLSLTLVVWRATLSKTLEGLTPRIWSRTTFTPRKALLMERGPSRLKCWARPYSRGESGPRSSTSRTRCFSTSSLSSSRWWTSADMRPQMIRAQTHSITYSRLTQGRRWHRLIWRR